MSNLRPNAAAAVFAIASAYAVLRYNVLKGVPWEYLPLYVLNKSVAWTAITLVLIGVLQALRDTEGQASARSVSLGYTFGGLHVVMSLILMSPTRFPELYDSAQQLTALGGLSLLAGVLGVAAAFGGRGWRFGAVVFSLAIAAHCTLLGARGWLTPSKWPGHLVPITLISSLTAIAAMVVAFAVWRRTRQAR